MHVGRTPGSRVLHMLNDTGYMLQRSGGGRGFTHRVGVGFLEGRELLPFYTEPARKQLLPFYTESRESLLPC